MKVINLWGGPGSGKSTTAAGLFHIMKVEGYSVELVTEFAKDLTWSERIKCLTDQFLVSANQNHSLERLKGKVDYAITDSPLLLGLIYDNRVYRKYPAFLKEVFYSYTNENFFLERVKKYVNTGRNQTEDEAKEICGKIQKMLDNLNVSYLKIRGDSLAPEAIFNIIK